jgi:class 3 adenylate cyclase
MAIVSRLEGTRSRGIVWVCDIAESSKFLNDDKSAGALEAFLQRFLFVSMVFVEAAGGKYIKWTGDGFLAWFETPLLRDAGKIASKVFNAAWNLSFYVNVSQLCVEAPVKFKIRHAVTFEHDALVLDVAHSDKSSSDVLGRAVVLAFRLSSIKAYFPSILTHGDLLRLTKSTGIIHFRKMRFSRSERLKYFKGEERGISDVFSSSERRPRTPSLRTLLVRTKKLIDEVEGRRPFASAHPEFFDKVLSELSKGPTWCQEIQKNLHDFLQTNFLGALKELVPILEQTAEEPPRAADKPTNA